MKLFKIEENDANQRLDKFLKKIFTNATRSLIYKINRKNKVKVKPSLEPSPFPSMGQVQERVQDQVKFKKMDNEYKLQVGDELKIFLSDKEFSELTSIKQENNIIEKQDKFDKNDIVLEDSSLLIINKNAGINVHPGDHKTKESNLIYQVQDYLGDKLNSLTFKPSLIHRIDRDTSGIILIAKKKEILTKLVEDFKNHNKIKKTYYAIVFGKLSRREGTINKKLKRIENAKNQNKVQISDKGQTAISHYKLLKEHTLKTKEGNLIISEIEVNIETGRMHQIRVHMSGIGNPILGDKTYGDKKINAFLKNNYGLERQALHAWKIEFFHYGRNKKINLEARIKDDLQDFIKQIKN